MAHRPVLRVISLLPSATDTVNALIKKGQEDGEALPFELCGCTHECDLPFTTVSGSVPVRLTQSRIGDIPIDDIELAFNSSVAAIDEFMALRQPLAIPLIQFGLSAYELDLDELCRIKPDVILTCLQTAHSCILEGELAAYAFESVLGYVPRIVHTEGQTLEEVYRDMLKISEAVGGQGLGRELVASVRGDMERIGADVRRALSNTGEGSPASTSVSVVWWASPVLAASAWVQDMLDLLGVKNVGDDWERANMVVWCLCGLGIDVAEREARKLVARAARGGNTSEGPGPNPSPGPPVRQRMAAMDGVRHLSRPGPLLVESMACLADMIVFGGVEGKGGDWRWI
mmetsp:Transcript_5771/g.16195  ORF Transcript_5771/g.16195 Transcript_5771/m.16195 type:complete len:343 (+) Transcript_5771:172-1200(+)